MPLSDCTQNLLDVALAQRSLLQAYMSVSRKSPLSFLCCLLLHNLCPGHTPGPIAPPAAASPPAKHDSPISRVVLVGLNIVLPLINAELLKFPKLAQLYYSLLSYMLEVYPKAVADMPPQHFASLMASLEWGLLGSDTVAVHCSLEGLAGLAKYQYQAVQIGAPGLAGQSAGEQAGGSTNPI